MRYHSYTILAILSCLTIAAWVITGFYGGMLLWALSYPFAILTALALYIFSFVQLIVFRKKIKGIVYAHALLWVFIVGVWLYSSELLKSKRILSAIFHDDLYNYELVLRENGKCEIRSRGIFFADFSTYGTYYLSGDTIVFTKIPYDNNDFIGPKALIDRKQQAIFIDRDTNGLFFTTKQEFNHFEIEASKN